MFSFLKKKDKLPKTTQQSKTFCVMPWLNLATETNGKCKLCCVVMTNKYINDQGNDFLIYEDKIEDIWNSDYLKDVRKKMLNGEAVADCSYCYNQDQEGQHSPRQQLNERWLDESIIDDTQFSSLNNGESRQLPRSLEPRPGTYCNLKCTMCWSMSSSSLHKERLDILNGKYGAPPEQFVQDWKYEIAEVEKMDLNWPSKPIYFENLRKCAPKMKRLYFTGGEPTMIKANLDLLEEVLKYDGKDVLIQMTTNTTQLSEKLLALLKKFKKVELTCSIDGYEAVNDYIRYPAKWNKLVDNFNYLTSQKNLIVSIMVAVQAINLYSLIDLLQWLSKRPGKKIHVITTFIPSPSQLTCKILPDNMIQEHIDCYKNALTDSRVDSYYHDVLTKVLNHLKQLPTDNIEKSKQQEKFREYTLLLDHVRSTKFKEIFPRYSSLVD